MAQAREISLERLVIFIVAIFFNNSYDGLCGDKPREIVNVAVGVVAGNAFAEPENIADTQIIPQTLFDLIARKIWIAILV